MRRFKKVLALTLGAALVVSSLSGVDTAQAAAKPKLSKAKLTVKVGKKATLTLKNVKKKQLKKVKWSTSSKKVAAITVKKKNVVTVKGKKAGKAKITAKLGKKKYVCNVTVKAVKKTTTKPTASASAGAVTASGSAAGSTAGSTAGTGSTPAKNNDPLLFTTAAPVPPANVQPAYRETPAPTETAVPLNTAQPGGDPEGEVGEVLPTRAPFTVSGQYPGESFEGGLETVPTATPVPATPDPSATAVPTVRVSGYVRDQYGSSLDYRNLYFYPEDSEYAEQSSYTDYQGHFNVPLKGSEFGTTYTVRAILYGSERTIGTIFVTNEAESLYAGTLQYVPKKFPEDFMGNVFTRWVQWDVSSSLSISSTDNYFAEVSVGDTEKVSQISIVAKGLRSDVSRVRWQVYDAKGNKKGSEQFAYTNKDTNEYGYTSASCSVSLTGLNLSGGTYYIQIIPEQYESSDDWDSSSSYTRVSTSMTATFSKTEAAWDDDEDDE